jgi:hypothetical protein
MASTDLATVPEQQIARRFGKMVEASADVVDIADRTHKISRGKDGALVRPEGMSDAEWNIHCDAMQSERNAPIYLKAHYQRVETAQKIAGARGAELPPVAGYVLHLMERKVYPTVDVTSTKEGE